jgi:hypothetical protein
VEIAVAVGVTGRRPNGVQQVRPLNRLLEQASLMLEARAYLHHYEKHGVQEADVRQAMMTAEQILFDYRGL